MRPGVRMRLALVTAILFSFGPAVMNGAPAKAEQRPDEAHIPFAQSDAREAVTKLATALEEDFVFPNIGKAYAKMLRAKLAAGAYSSFPDAWAFAEQVNHDLQAVHKDRHLGMRPIQKSAPNPLGDPSASAVGKAGWLADGVAYIELRRFTGSEASLADIRKFLATHNSAKTLILDARQKGGGGLNEMSLIFSEIFAKPTVLVDIDFRRSVEEEWGSPFGGGAMLRKIRGPVSVVRREHFVIPAADDRDLKSAKVYLLTSHQSFSATEHLAFSLKRTKRAILVGETTAGGAHFGGSVPLGSSYAVFIPFGRTFDPNTGKDWEGIGVKPDIQVPAEKALDEALRLAGVNLSSEAALAALR